MKASGTKPPMTTRAERAPRARKTAQRKPHVAASPPTAGASLEAVSFAGTTKDSVERPLSQRGPHKGTRMGALGGFALQAAIADGAKPPQAPLKALLSAVADASRALSLAESLLFLSEPPGVTHVAGLSANLESVLPYLSHDDEAVEGSPILDIVAAQHTPQSMTIGQSPGHHRGGLSVWRNDVFATDFFVKAHTTSADATALRARAAAQPWFEWNAQTGSVTHHETGAAQRLLDGIEATTPRAAGSHTVSLYRGTSAHESLLLSLRADLAEGKLAPKWREQVVTALDTLVKHAQRTFDAYEDLLRSKLIEPAELEPKRAALAAAIERATTQRASAHAAQTPAEIDTFLRSALADVMTSSAFGGLFVTPDAARAADFSKGKVVRFDMTFAALRALCESAQLYVGIERIGESSAIELAFLSSPGSNAGALADLLASAYAGTKNVKPGVLFN